ncbi:hypothetical protein DYI37_17335 [Fulvimarina endophytica]|uniref:Integrase catalytic domain-containing protein n=1 Tax=Fulvimarina endophytica TaxID=2293836 RepID=A0A371WZ44_9HYPH|nr:hypothetical protein DYI37_17335 [Fulvimarina endophytica]
MTGFLNTHSAKSLGETRAIMEAWRRDYNEVQPYSVIGHNTPIELMKCSGNAVSAWAETFGIVSAGRWKGGSPSSPGTSIAGLTIDLGSPWPT